MINEVEYLDYYSNLIIIQYKNKPKAKATIQEISGKFYEIYKTAQDVINMLDIDNNEGVQLDVIGEIVGIGRSVPNAIDLFLFGFGDIDMPGDYSTNALPFGNLDAFNNAGGISDLSENPYTSLQLSDIDYRKIIKAKISSNTSSSSLFGDGIKPSLNDSISLAFEGLAYVSDNSDMSLNLHVDYSVSVAWIGALFAVGVVPKPQGVIYKHIVRESIGEGAFGFGDTDMAADYSNNASPFGDILTPNGGAGFAFAELLSI